MADAALAEAMGSLKIERRGMHTARFQDTNHHVLELSYPDFAIAIPPHEDVELSPPAKMEHRSRPPHDPRDLALYDTNFALSLPLQHHKSLEMHYSTEYMRLFAAVEALRSGAGTTKIGVLRLHEEIWDEKVFRVRLETHWVGPFPQLPPREFDLSGAGWEALMSYAHQRPWIDVLAHLVNRASAKAYYHVRQRLMAKVGAAVVDEEEKSWPTAWGTKREVYAAELFLGRLDPVNDNIIVGQMPHFTLECGHSYHLTCDEALKVNGNTVWQLGCEICQTRIMKPEDVQYLDAVVERNNTYRFSKMQRVWANLVQNVHKPNKPRHFHAMSIFRVIGAALDSLRSPEWVAPSAICPSNFRETKEVLEHLETVFWDSNHFYERTAEELLDDLEMEALGVRVDNVPLREKVNPPGWDDFVARWLRRTAYFLAYRRCGRGEYQCKGLHGHRDGLWYTPEKWESCEAERNEKKDTTFATDDLMRALEAIPM